MRFIETNGRIFNLLASAREGGVVLDYAFLGHDPAPVPSETFHRRAALMAVEAWHPDPGIAVPSVEPAKARGQFVNVDQFYGPVFDRERRRLLFSPRTKELAAAWKSWQERRRRDPLEGSGPFFWVGEDDPEMAVFIPGHVWGYADGFTSPPYSLHLTAPETQEIFLEIDDKVLGRPDESTEIMQWDCDWDPSGGTVWAPYFEWNWWGHCLWTLRTGPTRILAIGASASD